MSEIVCISEDDMLAVLDVLEEVKAVLIAVDVNGELLDKIDGCVKWCVDGGCPFKDMVRGFMESAMGNEQDVYGEIGMSLGDEDNV